MKKLDLSRIAPLALSAAMSVALCFVVVDSIAALGMTATAAMKASQAVAQPLMAKSHEPRVGSAANALVC